MHVRFGHCIGHWPAAADDDHLERGDVALSRGPIPRSSMAEQSVHQTTLGLHLHILKPMFHLDTILILFRRIDWLLRVDRQLCLANAASIGGDDTNFDNNILVHSCRPLLSLQNLRDKLDAADYFLDQLSLSLFVHLIRRLHLVAGVHPQRHHQPGHSARLLHDSSLPSELHQRGV